MFPGPFFKALRGLPHILTSTSAREEISHVRLLVGGENVLATFLKLLAWEVKVSRVCYAGYGVLISHRFTMVHGQRLANKRRSSLGVFLLELQRMF